MRHREDERRHRQHDDGNGDGHAHHHRLGGLARNGPQRGEQPGQHHQRHAAEENERAGFRAAFQRRRRGGCARALPRRRREFAGFQAPLILGIVLEFLADAQLNERGDDHRQQGGRHADEEDLNQPDVVRGQQADHRRGRRRHRAGGDGLLRRNGGDGHRALGPDAAFVRDLVDHRQQRIHDVARARGEGESVGHQRRDDRHLLRVLADDALRHAHEEIHAARHFHRRRRHDDRQHDDEHLAGNRAGRNAKAHHQHQQADRAPQAEPHAARPRAHQQRAEEDQEFEDELSRHAGSKDSSYACAPLFRSPQPRFPMSTGHGSARQISFAYSAMVRSLENLPEAAMFKMVMRDHASGSV